MYQLLGLLGLHRILSTKKGKTSFPDSKLMEICLPCFPQTLGIGGSQHMFCSHLGLGHPASCPAKIAVLPIVVREMHRSGCAQRNGSQALCGLPEIRQLWSTGSLKGECG